MRVTYLSHDALAEGVGASQVGAYVTRLPARGIDVDLHTFEKTPPSAALRGRLEQAGVSWTPHTFGRLGASGGISRVVRGALAVRGATLVHARADLAGGSALLAGVDRWLWDCRGLYADQRIALDRLRPGSTQHRVLRRLEGAACKRADAVVVLTDAVLPVLTTRYGDGIRAKASVITTCTDLDRFRPSPPPTGVRRWLLAGTINHFYDVPLMVRMVRRAALTEPTEFVVAAPEQTAWEHALAEADALRVQPSPEDVPPLVASSHVGLCVCRADAGVSLTGSMPTKIGEFLASGRPVVVNQGLGDAAALVATSGCGVVVPGDDDADIDAAVNELQALLHDPQTAERCRALAEAHFDLEKAVDQLAAIYLSLAGS